MQLAPVRLQQAIWNAFRAAKPVHKQRYASVTRRFSSRPSPVPLSARQQQLKRLQPLSIPRSRFYSDEQKSDIDKKIEDAQQRVNDGIEARAETTTTLQDAVKSKTEETIIHTLPESSSIVYNPDAPGESAADNAAAASVQSNEHPSSLRSKDSSTKGLLQSKAEQALPDMRDDPSPNRQPLPSQLAARYSQLRGQFVHFMDNFQTHIFRASKSLNDLTGYSSIEQLKQDIEAQEHAVRNARLHVKDTRNSYSSAIATRSDTQREVNDLLQRKHAWSPADLERFTNLYRSDHANEQAEQRSHEELSRAEQAYEEASTKLSKSILARYHEEQVWSDKIRQMSTWGTWGLMGLNVLLFIVFQIMIEPWRRRRLVRGFEEKVQEAIREQTAETELRTIFHLKAAQQAAATGSTTEAPAAEPVSASVADALVAAITEGDGMVNEMAERAQIEQTAETVATAEVLSETQAVPIEPTAEPADAAAPSISNTDLAASLSQSLDEPIKEATNKLPPLSTATYADLSFVLGVHVRAYLDQASSHVQSLFNNKETVEVSRRDLTAKVLEGAFCGAVGVVTLFWIAGVGAIRGR